MCVKDCRDEFRIIREDMQCVDSVFRIVLMKRQWSVRVTWWRHLCDFGMTWETVLPRNKTLPGVIRNQLSIEESSCTIRLWLKIQKSYNETKTNEGIDWVGNKGKDKSPIMKYFQSPDASVLLAPEKRSCGSSFNIDFSTVNVHVRSFRLGFVLL